MAIIDKERWIWPLQSGRKRSLVNLLLMWPFFEIGISSMFRTIITVQKNFLSIWKCWVWIFYFPLIKMLSIPCYTRYQDLNKSTKMIFFFMLYFSNVIFILTGHYLLLAYQIQHERGIAAFSICLFIGNIFQGLSI